MADSLDDICVLIKKIYNSDDIGQEISKEIEREIFCKEKPIYNNEFFAAGQNNIKAALNLIIDAEEYEGERELLFYEQRYSIYRIFKREDDFTELYCEVIAGGEKAL